jgi:outer membrane biosynthesis protein TonB
MPLPKKKKEQQTPKKKEQQAPKKKTKKKQQEEEEEEEEENVGDEPLRAQDKIMTKEDWKVSIENQLDRAKFNAGSQHAIQVGFGNKWYKQCFTTGTKRTNKKGKGVEPDDLVRFFDKVPKKSEEYESD